MEIRFVTNACMEILAGSARILCDPWLSGRAFDGAWTQWPPLRLRPEDFTRYTHVYVSHIHPDHCDPYTLRRLPNKEVPVIILGSEDSRFLRSAIAACGFHRFIELADGESVGLEGARVTMHKAFAPNPFIAAEVPNMIDSSIVVEDGAYRFINLNDNTPDLPACKRLMERYRHFDAATVPYSGVGPYPSSYEGTAVEKSQRAHGKAQQYLARMVEIAAVLKAGVYFPAAGQMRLVGRQAHKNEALGVETQWQAADLLRKKGFNAEHLLEGSVYDLVSGARRESLPPSRLAPEVFRELGAERYWWEDAFRIPPQEQRDLLPLLQVARERLGRYQERYAFAAPWLMAVRVEERPEEAYVFSYASSGSKVERRSTASLMEGGDKFLMATVPYGYLIAILSRHCHWNNAYHGCHAEWVRRPDEYVPELQMLLSFFHL